MHLVHRSVAIPALGVLLAAGAQECEAPGTLKSCGLRPEVRVEDQRVVGTVTAACEVPPDIHDLELRLQLLDNRAQWKNAGKRTSAEIPRPGHMSP